MPYDPFDFDERDGYQLVPVDQAWPQVDLMDDPNMRHYYATHPHETAPRDLARRSRRRVPAVIVAGQHGGWRPGSGAPYNNTNAFKTGAHSPRLTRGAKLVAQSPQLRDLIAQLVKANQRNQKRRLDTALGVAYEATLTDPTSRNSINQILQNGILRRLDQIQTEDTKPKRRKNNQNNQPPPSSLRGHRAGEAAATFDASSKSNGKR